MPPTEEIQAPVLLTTLYLLVQVFFPTKIGFTCEYKLLKYCYSQILSKYFGKYIIIALNGLNWIFYFSSKVTCPLARKSDLSDFL